MRGLAVILQVPADEIPGQRNPDGGAHTGRAAPGCRHGNGAYYGVYGGVVLGVEDHVSKTVQYAAFYKGIGLCQDQILRQRARPAHGHPCSSSETCGNRS